MQIYDFVDEGLGHSSYLIEISVGTATLVDPPRFPIAQESLAARRALHIAWTFDSHSHADYVTGSPGLHARLGSTFVAPAASHLETPHHAIDDGGFIDIGNDLKMIALSTPGHTKDHCAYLLEQSGEPVALFSGGSLMVGTIGRTDLCGEVLTEPLARSMFHSLRRFDELPDNLRVYPTHGTGSFCSSPGSSERTTTLGLERIANPLFACTNEDQFVEQLLDGFGTFPTYFARLPELNRLGPHQYNSLPQLARLNPDQVERHLQTGGVVVDTRSAAAFAQGHVPGSISITMRPVFGSWLGWLVKPDEPIVFILDEHQDRDQLVRQCLDIGYEQFVGELEMGMHSWTASSRPAHTIEFIDESDVVSRQSNREGNTIIDVRQVNEFKIGHVPHALNVELGTISQASLPVGALTMMCGHGERAMTSASILARLGRTDLVVFDGSPETWSLATRIPLEAS